jgi:hypothetical protein
MALETIGPFATLASVLQTWRASSRGRKEGRLQALSKLSKAVTATTNLSMASAGGTTRILTSSMRGASPR